MSIAHILKETILNSSESLVLLSITSDTDVKEYIAVASHLNHHVSFRSVEEVTSITRDRIFLQRSAFNGRSADVIVNPRNERTLNSKKITIEKDRSPTMSSTK